MDQYNEEVQALVSTIRELYAKIAKQPSLSPSEDVNELFTKLVNACIPHIDIPKLTPEDEDMRSKLISLCSNGEGLLESHHSDVLVLEDKPSEHLNKFPYYQNYVKLSELEYVLLSKHVTKPPEMVAFVGSGPLPLSSFVLAMQHMVTAKLHNYDISDSANERASKLVHGSEDLENRMEFYTTDIMDVKNELKNYDVVFLAALVGMDKEAKVRIIEHLGKFMAPGALLVARSAHGARSFLYPVVDCEDLKGFQVLEIYHPSDEVINSVIVARKPEDVTDGGRMARDVIWTCRYCELVQGLNHLRIGSMREEDALEKISS